MKNKILTVKKVISIISVIFVLTGICSFPVCAENTNMKDSKVQNKIDKLEAEISKMEDEIMKNASNELSDKKLNDSERQSKQENFKEKINSETQKILSKYGFKPVNSGDSLNTIAPMSTSSSITLTDQIQYDSTTGLYRFQGDWNFTDGQWDMLCDAEDMAGVRMINTINYQIYSSFCKTWDEFGTQTGYVDQNGQHSPSDSNCTKRMEDSAGVAYNIIDEYVNLAGLIIYPTDQGRITQYIKKNSGATSNKVFLDFNHNYKYTALNIGASITNVGFTGTSNALSVSYSHVNGLWQRCSGGREIN